MINHVAIFVGAGEDQILTGMSCVAADFDSTVAGTVGATARRSMSAL